MKKRKYTLGNGNRLKKNVFFEIHGTKIDLAFFGRFSSIFGPKWNL